MELVFLGLASAIASLAMVFDLRTRRIPNWLTFGAAGLGLLAHLGLGGPAAAGSSLLGAGLGLALLLPFFLLKGMGAGDVKLLAGLGALLGPQPLLSVALYGALAGGALSLLVMLQRGHVAVLLHQALVLKTLPGGSGLKAPYAVAIAAGVYATALLEVLGR